MTTAQNRGYCTMQEELNIRARAKRAGLNAFLTGASRMQLTALGRAYYDVFQKAGLPMKDLRQLASTMEAA